MTRIALIDADTVIFTAASANQYDCQWEPFLWTLHANFDDAVAQLNDMVEDIREGLEADQLIMALSDETRWRPGVMPGYKASRKSERKPVIYKALREYVHERYKAYQRPTLEGDDVLGILATHPTLLDGEKIIVSIDKDMKTIPGLHCNYVHDRMPEGEPWVIRTVTEEEADRFHLFQTLSGDKTDGYSGCPGIGPVKAERLLDDDCSWETVVRAYEKAGLSEEVALQNARVARICRHTDYDFKTKEVVLWTPKPSSAES